MYRVRLLRNDGSEMSDIHEENFCASFAYG